MAPSLPSATPRGIRTPLLLVLALLASVAPFATDLYLSAFPRMATDLATSDTAIQLTLTAFLVGLAAGQLVFGPLSDRVGRRGPLLIGAAIFVAASVAVVVAPSIQVLLAARVVQGLSGAAGMVLGRAVIADLETGRAAARAFSLMMIVAGIAPVVAPLLGSVLVDAIGWRGVLAMLCALALAMLVASFLVVAESLPRERRGARGGGGLRALGQPAYLAAALTFAFSFSVMMAYISASPFLYQDLLGMTELQYGLCFALNAAGLIASSAIGARLLRRREPMSILGAGVGWLAGALVLLVACAFLPGGAAWIPVPLFLAVASLGFVMGPATGLALGAVPEAAGTGSAVLGAAQFGLAAVVSPLVSLGEGAVPMALVMASLGLVAVVSFLALRRARRNRDAAAVAVR